MDAFTDRVFGGNPAGVVPEAEGLSEDEMQNIASEMNLSETAFILPSDKADFAIRWFTPKTEVPFCGHATVASLHVLAEEGNLGMDRNGVFSLQIETLIGILAVDVVKSVNYIKIILQSPEIDLLEEKLDMEKLSDSFNLKYLDFSYPVMRDNTLDYVYIVFKDLSSLKSVEYDYDKLESFSKEHNIKGFTLISTETFQEDSEVHSRFFSPAYGIKEDPVTGSAQGPLGVYLILNNLIKMDDAEMDIKSEQGHIMGRPGLLTIRVIKDKMGNLSSKLIGEAVTVLNGEFIL